MALSPLFSLSSAYQAAFGGFSPTGPSDPVDPGTPDDKTRRRRSSLDLVKNELAQLSARRERAPEARASCRLDSAARAFVRNAAIPEVGQPGDWHNTFMHSDRAPFTRLIKLEQWLCGQFVSAVQKLKGIVMPDGETLLDKTLVVWARDMGDGPNHGGDDMRACRSSVERSVGALLYDCHN